MIRMVVLDKIPGEPEYSERGFKVRAVFHYADDEQPQAEQTSAEIIEGKPDGVVNLYRVSGETSEERSWLKTIKNDSFYRGKNGDKL